MFTFEYHPRKAADNLRKHKVSFEEAITVFNDPLRSVLFDDQYSDDEERLITVGQSSQRRVLFVVYTETESTVRIIGAREVDAREREQYEEDV